MLFVHEASGVCDTIFGTVVRYGPGDYLGPADRDDLAAGSRRGIRPAILSYLEAPSEIEPPQALPERRRPAPQARPRTRSGPPRPGRGRAATSRRVRDRLRSMDRITAYDYRHDPFDLVGWEWLSLAVPLQYRRLPADHRARPPTAARPPDVRGPQLRLVLVRAREFDYHPLAIPAPTTTPTSTATRSSTTSPATHEPTRRGDRLVHAPSGRMASRAGSGHGRGLDRQGGDRGAGRHGRHLPSAPVTQAAMDLDDPELPGSCLLLSQDSSCSEASRALREAQAWRRFRD